VIQRFTILLACVLAATTPTAFSAKRCDLQFEYLGSGSNGKVYLATKPDGTKFSRKFYLEGSETNLVADEIALGILEKAEQKYRSIHAVKVLRISGMEMDLTYVKGVTLLDVLNKELLSSQDKLKVMKKYNRLINDLKKYLEENYRPRVSEITPDADRTNNYYAHMVLNGRDVQFQIKLDNVIVDPKTLKITIIDPH
jgi:hypothetical protein